MWFSSDVSDTTVGPAGRSSGAPQVSHRIVATHGLGDGAATWAPVTERLAVAAPRVTVDAWDLAGHGSSPAPAGDVYRLEDALADLGGVVARGARPVVLMGHSLGGYLSLRYALAEPGEVEALVLVGTGPGYRSADGRARWNRYLERTASTMDIAPGVAEVALQRDSVVIDRLGEIGAPVLVLSGTRDERFHAGADVIASRVPDGRHELVPGSGHHPHLDDPDGVATRIAAFLGTLPRA
jgi:pimeloyl-ACP methyl ester carboxylesterase